MKFKSKAGFTLIELLVVIVIIGIIATLATVALGVTKVKTRDAKRISDIKQLQTALELYYNEESTYPPTSALTVGKALVGAQSGKTFMAEIPAGPNIGETYNYAQVNNGISYILGYTLEKTVNEFAAGTAVAFPGNIHTQCSPNCGGKCNSFDGCGGKCPNNCSGGTPYCNANTCSATKPTPCSDTAAAATECTASSAYGAICGGGTLLCKSDNAACGGANIVVAPSNCTNATTCNCATDTVTKVWDNSGVNAAEASPYTATDLYNGLNNLNGHNPSSIYEAAKFCTDLNINGFSDWYLPSKAELCAIVRSGNHCGGLSSSYTCVAGNKQTAGYSALNSCTNASPLVSGLESAYFSSTDEGDISVCYQNTTAGYQGYATKTGTSYVRCVRRFN